MKHTGIGGKPLSLILAFCIMLGLLFALDLPASAASNSAPTVANTSVTFPTITEDVADSSDNGITVSELLNLAGASDADGNTLSIAVTSVDDSTGRWELYDGNKWWSLTKYKTVTTVSDSNIYLVPNGCSIRFLPGADFNGQASFTFRVWDETSGTADNSDGDAAIDTSGSNHGGSTTFSAGTVTASIAVTPVNDVPQIHKYSTGNVLNFDGSNDYVSVPDLGLNNDSFTVEGWIYARSANTYSRFFDLGKGPADTSADGRNLIVHLLGDAGKEGYLAFEVWNGTDRANNMCRIETSSKFTLNQWVYVSAVYNSATQRGYLYCNGSLAAQGSMKLTQNTTIIRDKSYFGRSNWTADQYFNGKMRNIAVWKEARTPGQVAQDMNTSFRGTEPNLVLYYPLNDAVGGTAVQSATGGNSGSLMNYASSGDTETSTANEAMIVNDSTFDYQISGFARANISVDQMYLKDVDAGAAGVSLTLSATNGTLTLNPTDGVSVTGNKSASLTASGTVDDLNATLKTLTYLSSAACTDTITATVTDGGNSGSGGSLSVPKLIGVTVNAAPDTATTPTITVQPPSSVTVALGQQADFSVTVTGPTNSSSYTCQWQVSTNGGSTWSDISGAIGSSYSISSTTQDDNGTQYRCYVYDATDNTSTTSDKATLTVIYPILKAASMAPANGATGVAVNTQLAMTFNEDVSAASGNICVVGPSSTVYTIPVTGSNVTINNNIVTVTLPGNLDYITKYHILIDAGAFVDTYNVAYAGLSDSTAWSFTTTAASNTTAQKPPVAGSGDALSFDGNYVDLGESNNNLILGKTFTEEAWVYPSEKDDKYHGFLGNEINHDSITRAPGIWVYDYNKVHIGFGSGTAWYELIDPDDVLTSNAWNHIAVVYDGNIYYLYINGVLKAQKTLNATPCNTPVRFIGQVDNTFSGQLDEVKLWKTARTQDNIQSDMYNRPSSGETGLVGYWNFDEGSGTAVTDWSVAKNNGTLTNAGDSAWVNSVAWQNRATAQNTPLVIDAGYAPDGGSVTLAATTNPTNGALVFNDTNKTVTYTPAVDFFGTDSFTYTVTNTDNSSSNYTVNMTVVQDPVIKTQPADQAVALGSAATLTVTVSAPSAGLTYQWQKYDGSNWDNIPNATDATYTSGNVAVGDAGQYRCVVNAMEGTTTAVTTSGAAMLTVTYSVTVTNVSGIIKDTKGNPVSSATVTLTDIKDSSKTYTGTTDANGNYTIPSVPNGSYTITVTKDGETLGSGNVSVNGGDVTGGGGDITVKPPTPPTEPTHSITGVIKDTDNKPVVGATVKLMAGSRQIAQATTDGSGNFSILGVPQGTYNLVISKGTDQIITLTITVSDSNIAIGSVTLPKGNKNSVVEVKSNTPDIVVDKLNDFFDSNKFTQDDSNVVNAGGTVEIKLIVEKKAESGDNAAENADRIKTAAGSEKTIGMFLDLSLNKIVTPSSGTAEQPILIAELEDALIIDIPLPAELQGKSNYVIYRYHGTAVQTITQTINADGEYLELSADGKSIKLHTKKFSTYAIAYTEPPKPSIGSVSHRDSGNTVTVPTVTADSNNGGKLTISTDKKTVTITPDEGYLIADVLVDGKSVGAMASDTFTDSKDHKISAVFVKKSALPYYLQDGKKVFIGFTATLDKILKYTAPDGVTVQFEENPKRFTDIQNHWAKANIDFVTERETFAGTAQNVFAPQTSMTRAMFVTAIGRLYERSYGSITGNTTFSDVDTNAYYAPYVAWANKNGIIKGIGANKFAPDTEVTREQMAAIMFNFASFLGKEQGNRLASITYPDKVNISDWAMKAAAYCQQTGIITGREGGKFAPQATATRAEVTAVVERFVKEILK